MVEIAFAKKSDRKEILSFLNEHWQRGHIFTKDSALFDWQHGLLGSDDLSFVLGRREEDGEILGILGYVPTQQYDPQTSSGDFTLATWKVRGDCEVNGLGVFLFKALTKRMKPDFVGVVGLSDMVVPIYKALRFETGKMFQHVFFNRDGREGGLTEGVGPAAVPLFSGPSEPFRTVRDLGKLPVDIKRSVSDAMAATLPLRGLDYLVGRYHQHPVYQYAISVADRRACFVWRKIETSQGSCLRVVDYFGDPAGLSGKGEAFQALLEAERADYIDIVHTGLDGEALLSAGFVERHDVEGLIVPHYFEPFERRNVDLDYAWRIFDKNNRQRPILLRGFTDQDRPNQLHDGVGETARV